MQAACQNLSQLFLLINLQANRIVVHQRRAQKSEAVQLLRRGGGQSEASENIGYRRTASGHDRPTIVTALDSRTLTNHNCQKAM
jgi:hypothetical protein